MKKTCRIRPDLIALGYGVPISRPVKVERMLSSVEEGIYYGKGRVEYRWLYDTSGFQIKVGKRWWDAYSIDFDFLGED